MTIDQAMVNLLQLAEWSLKMRRIIDNIDLPTGTRYQAAVTEEHHLDLMMRHINLINDLKSKDVKIDDNIYGYNTKNR